MAVQRHVWVRVGLFLLLLVTACGDGGESTTGPPTPVPTTVSVAPLSGTLEALGATTQFSASVKDQSGAVMAGAAVTWRSSDPLVATVSSSGLGTAASNGTATITATSGSVSGTASLTVSQAVASVQVTPADADLTALDETVQLSVSVQDALGNEVTGTTVTWESSDESVATVDVAGLVTAEAKGSVAISAASGQFSGSSTVTVETNEVRIGPEGGTFMGAEGKVELQVPAGAVGQSTIITVEVAAAPPTSDQLVAGTAYEFGPDGTLFNNPVQLKIGYDPAGIPAGIAEADLRLYRAEGQTWESVEGSQVDVGTKKVTGSVQGFSQYGILGPPPVQVESVELSPASADVKVGATVAFTARVFDADGSEVFGRTVAWDTGDHAKATVNGTGVVTGVAEGVTTVTATSGGVSGSALVTVAPVGFPNELQWEIQSHKARLGAVWGSSPSDVFAVGFNGAIFHFDGTSWSPQVSGTPLHLHAVWGSSSTDVFAAGGTETYSGQQVILHFDGTAWEVVYHFTGSKALYGVWGSSPTDVFAVGGYDGTILPYDGITWSDQTSDTPTHLFGVWGSSSTDVFAVGNSTILHYDGNTWSVQDSGFSGYLALRDVWGASSTDVFAVGGDTYGNSVVLHYDGSGWSRQPSGTTEDLGCVWGSSSTDVFAVGSFGSSVYDLSTILHYDGTSWSQQLGGTEENFRGVWSSSPTDVFAVSLEGTIFHYDGVSWSEESLLRTSQVNAFWGTSSTDVFAVGVGSGPGSYTNSYYAILHFNGTAWSVQAEGPVKTYLAGIWGTSINDVVAVGGSNLTSETGIILHYDGSGWSPQPSETTSEIMGVWGSSPSDVFAVGLVDGRGAILHYDGTSWNAQDIGVMVPLMGVWGSSATDVFAVGPVGAILHYDGASWSWSMQPTPIGHNLNAVWGSSATDVFAVGERGVIFHYDGTSWSRQYGTARDLFAVWGSSSTDVFAVGEEGVIIHYDGIEWSFQDSGVTTDLLSVWGSSSTNVFVGGENGIILHGRR